MQYMKYIYKVYPYQQSNNKLNDTHFAVVLGAST